VQLPEWPVMDYRAAVACLLTGRFDSGAVLATRFLGEPGPSPHELHQGVRELAGAQRAADPLRCLVPASVSRSNRVVQGW
jgi:hypothetical protein